MNPLPFLTLLIIAFSKLARTSQNDKRFELNTSHFSVEFSPFVQSLQSVQNSGLRTSHKDILTLLVVASSRFNKLTVPNDGLSTNSIQSLTSIMTAYFNNATAAPSSKFKLTLKTSPFQNISEITHLILKVNQIHPRTIQAILVNSQLSDGTLGLSNLTIYLQNLHKNLSKLGIKLGLNLYLHQCDQFYQHKSKKENIHVLFEAPDLLQENALPEDLKKVVEFSDFLVFSQQNKYLFQKHEQTIDYLTREFSVCKKSVEKYVHGINKTVDVHLGFEWASKGEDIKNTPHHFVNYWKLLGDWAVKNNEVIFIKEAFDNPVKQLGSNSTWKGNMGWFRLKDENENDITKDSFIEKYLDEQVEPKIQVADNELGIAELKVEEKPKSSKASYLQPFQHLLFFLIFLYVCCG